MSSGGASDYSADDDDTRHSGESALDANYSRDDIGEFASRNIGGSGEHDDDVEQQEERQQDDDDDDDDDDGNEEEEEVEYWYDEEFAQNYEHEWGEEDDELCEYYDEEEDETAGVGAAAAAAASSAAAPPPVAPLPPPSMTDVLRTFGSQESDASEQLGKRMTREQRASRHSILDYLLNPSGPLRQRPVVPPRPANLGGAGSPAATAATAGELPLSLSASELARAKVGIAARAGALPAQVASTARRGPPPIKSLPPARPPIPRTQSDLGSHATLPSPDAGGGAPSPLSLSASASSVAATTAATPTTPATPRSSANSPPVVGMLKKSPSASSSLSAGMSRQGMLQRAGGAQPWDASRPLRDHDRAADDARSLWDEDPADSIFLRSIKGVACIDLRGGGAGKALSSSTAMLDHMYDVSLSTFNQLVVLLTDGVPSEYSAKRAHQRFVRTFFHTLLTFASPSQVLDKMLQRYHAQPLASDSPQRLAYYAQVKRAVLGALHHWHSSWIHQFTRSMRERTLELATLAKQHDEAEVRTAGRFLEKSIESRMRAGSYRPVLAGVQSTPAYSGSMPEPVLPKGGLASGAADHRLLDIDALELARQLTIADHDAYAGLNVAELLGGDWASQDPEKKAGCPGLLAVIDRFNHVTNIVMHLIVNAKLLWDRTRALVKIIDVMGHLQSLNNFFGLMGFASCMSSAPIKRLKHTFASLPEPYRQRLAEFRAVCSPSGHYAAYRSLYNSIPSPAVPYTGCFLQDLLYVKDGNEDAVCGLINFHKRSLMFDVVERMLSHQTERYKLKLVPVVQQMVSTYVQLNEKQLYELSLEVEPRGAPLTQLPGYSRRKRKKQQKNKK
jgi:RasGEF domain/RasGEF N-terminal motif